MLFELYNGKICIKTVCFFFILLQRGTKGLQNPTLKGNHGRCNRMAGSIYKIFQFKTGAREDLQVSDFVSPSRSLNRYPNVNFAVEFWQIINAKNPGTLHTKYSLSQHIIPIGYLFACQSTSFAIFFEIYYVVRFKFLSDFNSAILNYAISYYTILQISNNIAITIDFYKKPMLVSIIV